MIRTLALVCCSIAAAQELKLGDLLYQEDFEGVADRWRFDGRGRQWIQDGRLQMSADGFECTAWFTPEIEGDVAILYQARILEPAGDRNINLIFRAAGPDGGDVLRVPFTGAYNEYHKLPNYIFTFTGTHSRLRRDPGFELASEDKTMLPAPDRTYDFAVGARGGAIRCWVNGRLVHSYDDPNPHSGGKLAFRTFRTRLWWDNLKVYRLRGDR
ncbi:MAG: hypothetical protein KIT09_03490 [Bryobacteraceae bacterium]|nr:hypothetical protein [Bryobacteraceae bacterium]